MKQISQKINYIQASLVLLFVFIFALLILSPSTAYAGLFDGAKSEACAGAEVKAVSDTNCTGDDKTALSLTIQNGIDLVSAIVGVIAVIMIIIGGIRFIVANGDSGKVTTARNTIIYALIGLILVAFSQTIVKFVLARI